MTALYIRTAIWLREKKEVGATGVEYGLLVALIAAVIVGTVTLLGTQIKTGFTDVLSELQK